LVNIKIATKRVEGKLRSCKGQPDTCKLLNWVIGITTRYPAFKYINKETCPT